MGELKKFFFDTYALFEIIHENKNYIPYLKVGVMTTKLNLMELHYRLLSLYGKEIADTAFKRFLPFSVEFLDDDIKEANQFKLINKKKKLSYVDCLGYIISRKRNVKFLTGDIQFKDVENVEFVK
ncbi:MAG: PIN domain-containing protein [Nanoarchaeota archaeon]